MKAAIKKNMIPFEFVLEELFEVSPYVKPMFSAFAVYVNEKIVFILRQKKQNQEDNGVWLATTLEHHKELKKLLPNMRSITVFGPGPTGWQILPEDSDDFEASVLKACQMVLNKDPKIGKIPKSKIRKKAKASKGIKKSAKKIIKSKKTKKQSKVSSWKR